jgi:hypothetical protein
MADAAATEVLTLRVPADLSRRLSREARRQGRTRGAVARDLLARALGSGDADPAAEAKRQSLLVSRRRSERETLRFIAGAADLQGWR